METDKEKITRLENRISELHSKNAALRFEIDALNDDSALWERGFVNAKYLSIDIQIEAMRAREKNIAVVKVASPPCRNALWIPVPLDRGLGW